MHTVVMEGYNEFAINTKREHTTLKEKTEIVCDSCHKHSENQPEIPLFYKLTWTTLFLMYCKQNLKIDRK